MRIVGGSLRGRRLAAPPGDTDIRPTSDRAREALFNILQHSSLMSAPIAGSRMLDLFAGTGAIACEALSRGAAHAPSSSRTVRRSAARAPISRRSA
jgi:16S rRNA (guanine966-N2)-methyltransferase